MAYLDENFLLHSATARRLFHEVAKAQPIMDYHCHLSPRDIAVNQRWDNLTQIWLGGDHYKWRLLRANGVAEELITGSASPREKFQAWAATVPSTLRNPSHHWTHLELQRYFDIPLLLSPESADEIWERANEKLAAPEFCAQQLLQKFNVRMVGTTDDPADPLDHHHAIAAAGLTTRVLPTFRPDKALQVDQPEALALWLDRLEAVADQSIIHLSDLLMALQKRHDDFDAAGGRLSDHGLGRCPALECSNAEASLIFDKARSGIAASAEENQRLPEWMTVEQLINFCRPMYPTWDPAFCTKLLEEFDLPLDRKLKHLSRGMKMKAALLTSLAYRPRLLVLDEPFSGLDPLVRDEVIRGMLELTEQENWTVLISSHDIDEVERLADWVTEHELDRTGAAQSAWKYLMALSITHPWDWEVHGLYSRLLVDAQQPGPAWQEAKLSLFLNPEPSLGDLNFFAFIGAIAAKGEWPEIQKAMKQAALDDKVAELAIVQSDKLFSANNKVSITVPKKS